MALEMLAGLLPSFLWRGSSADKKEIQASSTSKNNSVETLIKRVKAVQAQVLLLDAKQESNLHDTLVRVTLHLQNTPLESAFTKLWEASISTLEKNYNQAVEEDKESQKEKNSIPLAKRLDVIASKVLETKSSIEEAIKSSEVSQDLEYLRLSDEGEISGISCHGAYKEGGFYLKPANTKSWQIPPEEAVLKHVTGSFSGAKDLKDYLTMLEHYKGDIEHLPASTINDLLNDLYLNIPGDVVVKGLDKPVILDDQSAIDLHRFDRITINEQPIFDPMISKKMKGVSSEKLVQMIYEGFLKHFDKDEKLVNNLMRLITQGVMVHLMSRLQQTFNHTNLDIHLCPNQCLFVDIKMNKNIIEICYQVLFHIFNVKLEKPLQVGDIPANILGIRTVIVSKEDLQQGVVKNATIQESSKPLWQSHAKEIKKF